MNMYMCIITRIFVCMCICVCVCARVCICICTGVCICICVYIYVCICENVKDVAWSASGWPGPPCAAQTPTIEAVAWSGSGWPGPRGAAQAPKSRLVSFWAPVDCPDAQNRKCRLVGVRLASGPPGASQTPKVSRRCDQLLMLTTLRSAIAT